MEKLNISADETIEQPLLYQWSGHLKIVKRKNILVILHDESRFSFALYGLNAKHFANIGPMIIAGMRQSLLDNHIDLKTVNEYMKQIDHISFGKSRSPKATSRLNKAFERLLLFTDFLNTDETHQKILNKKVNHDLVTFSDGTYDYPSQRIITLLENEVHHDVISCRSYDLTCRLELENLSIWRRLIVPSDTTFKQFHMILQESFGWNDAHLYNFTVFNEDADQVLKLISEYEEVSDDEMSHSGGFITYAEYIEISTCLLEGFTTVYNYDYGDDWNIRITVNDSNLMTERLYPVCVMGEGDAPPEDVGGEPGFKSFIRIMNNQEHPEFNDMKTWAMSQHYQSFDIDRINKRIRHLLS
ncbi:MAG: plasmid pRiA4b ORF-3 family protein [Clostridia bacterium]|nr:plasmid pRiA4b ORF-3 family protein [Clostridia bacterium]